MANRRTSYQPSVYLTFDGAANSYIDLGATGIVPNATAAFSATAWIYMKPLGTGSTDSIRVIIGNRRDSTTSGWTFKVANKAKDKLEFVFFDQNSSSQGEIGDPTVNDDRWMHVGVTFDGRTTIFYHDGNPNQKNTLATPKTMTENTTQNLRIGHRAAGGSTFETFAGHMSDVCLWNRVLSADEMTDLYKSQIVPTTGLLARWKMDAGSGSTIADTLGVYNGTIVGGVTWATTQLVPSRTAVVDRASV